MNILLFPSSFPPEIGSSSQIYFDMAKEFAMRGHQVDVIVSYPREYKVTNNIKGLKLPLEEILEGVHIHRIIHSSKRDSLIRRGLEHFTLPIYYFREYLRVKKSYNRSFDFCLLHIPPLPLYYLTRLIKFYDGTPSILNLEDFHPQELTDVGFLTNPLVIWCLKFIEKRAYKKADFLTVHSPGGIDYVISRGANPDKVKLVFNSVDISILDDLNIVPDFKIKEKIENKTLISYAGIFSPFQGLDAILNVAIRLREHDEIIFYLVGDGIVKHHLELRVLEEKIDNVRILPYLTRNEYLKLVKSSDISLVSLDERMRAPCLPGKILNQMGLRQPIVAIVSPESETARLINVAECGVVVDPNDLDGLIQTLLYLTNNPELREKFGCCGRWYLEQNMLVSIAVNKYEDIANRLI